MNLQLSIPELSDTVDPAIETRGVYVEEWVEALPYADPLRLFRELFDRLREWNCAPLKASARLNLLELSLPAYLTMVERHTKLRALKSTSAFERYRNEADAARQVARQLAFGYKLVLLHSNERRLLGANKQIPIATQRAALLLAYGLLHGYHQYLPCVRNHWPELHELYVFAEQGRFHQQAGVACKDREETAHSIETIYSRAALLSTADPLHLTFGEVWTLFAALAQGHETHHVETPGAAHRPHAADIILSREDSPPRRQAHWVKGLPEGARYIESMPVAQALRQRQSSDQRALRRFADALEKPARRSNDRINANRRLRVTAGLASVHHFISEAAVRKNPDGADAPAEVDGTIDIEDLDPEETLPSRHLYIADVWQLANQSRTGICLTRERRSQNLPMVDELLGLRALADDDEKETASPWAVGIVRWLAIDTRKSHRMGIELLSSNARPVRLIGAGQQKPAALVLAAKDKGQVRLIVPAGTYRPSETITVGFNGHDISLKPLRTVFSSEHIECIECVN